MNVVNLNHLLFWMYSDGGRPSGASVFVGGFVLGGLIVGTLGAVYAPQVEIVVVSYLFKC